MSKTAFTALWSMFLILCCGLYANESTDFRNYNRGVTPSEASDIKFIITTMGHVTSPLAYAALVSKAGDLNRAGDRIDGVHPLQFLACIFSDEEMKISMRNIQKNQPWQDFLYGAWPKRNSGLANTFKEEANRGNLTPDQVHRFAQALGVDFPKYNNLIQNHRWEEVVASLINDIPRKGGYRKNDF